MKLLVAQSVTTGAQIHIQIRTKHINLSTAKLHIPFDSAKHFLVFYKMRK